MVSATLGLALFAASAAAQSVQVITAVGLATQCLPFNQQPTFPPAPIVNNIGNTINVNINAPTCYSCGCQGDGCTAIKVYKTTYQNFNSVGSLTKQTYVVTATYPGVSPSSAPSVAGLPCPLGFTTTVSTCLAGPTPSTATLTVPATTCPFVTGLSAPSTVPAGVAVPAYTFCPTVPAAAPTVVAVAPGAPAAPAAPGAPAAPVVPVVPVAPAAPAAPAAAPPAAISAAAAVPAAPGAVSAAGAVPVAPGTAAAPAPAGTAGSSPAAVVPAPGCKYSALSPSCQIKVSH